jgi:hypothetical protein
VVQSDADYVVVSCRIEVVMDEWKAEVEDIGEAWAKEFEARQKAAKESGAQQKPEAAGKTEVAPKAEAAPKGDEAMRYRMYRTAATRALKRAMELLVGDLNSLLKGLAVLYGYKQANNKGGLKAMPPEAAPIIRALGAGEIGLTDAIKGLVEVISKPQNGMSHEGQA